MTCHDAKFALDALLDRELGAEEEAALRRHLAGCPPCARELEDRRSFTGLLSESFGRALEGVRPAPGERERAAEGMAASSRRRLLLPARAAAVLVLGIAVGLVVHAFQRFTQAERERVAALVRDETVRREQIKRLRDETARELEFVNELPSKEPAQLVAHAGAAVIASKIDLAPQAAPPDPKERLSITQTEGSTTIRLSQGGDGRVKVVLPDRTIEVRSMAELQSRHADICRKFSIAGRDGFVVVAGKAAGVDFKGQLDLMFRTGNWSEDIQWEAYRAWVSQGPADKVEDRVRDVRERCRRALESVSVPPVAVDGDEIRKMVEKLTREQLDKTRRQIEAQMKDLEAELEAARELHGRARSLRVYAESLRKRP